MAFKVLFITRGNAPDYLNDCVFHGLNTLADVDLYSNSDLWYMYDDIDTDGKQSLYGKGFTIYGRIPSKSKIAVFKGFDKIKLLRLIREKFFDLVVYGSIWRCDSYLNFVRKYYEPSRVFLIDGEDHQKINKNVANGVYFKRENTRIAEDKIYPISFAVPEELVLESTLSKEKYWATVIPGNLTTYLFETEAEYFHDYAISRFAITTRKGGWDCLRHYEIMMNGCIPYFPFLDDCPPQTMLNFPKNEIKECNALLNQNLLSNENYFEKATYFLEYTRRNLTTKELAKYILSFV